MLVDSEKHNSRDYSDDLGVFFTASDAGSRSVLVHDRKMRMSRDKVQLQHLVLEKKQHQASWTLYFTAVLQAMER